MDLEKTAIYCGNLKKNIQKKINLFLKPYNITSIHAPYLLLLKHSNMLFMNEFNDLLGVDKANTARVIDYLYQQKMIDKTKEVRKYKVYLTDYGMKVTKELEKYMIAMKKKAIFQIEEEKIQIFNFVLLQIMENLKGE